jgi:serine/threonine protein kinase
MADQGSLSGKLLGNRYQLGARLGTGGFADVYVGEHIHLKTPCAVKVLHTLLSGENIEKFRNEARLVAHLEHPNILKVRDFDLENGVPFLVMDYAPNGSLRQRHPSSQRLPLSTLVSYVQQIADALQYAHDQRVIHRDIKPENLLLGRRNDILLSDFGIAVVAETTSQQHSQTLAGTPAYSAPEQLLGKPQVASDQYALGVVIYEWLCGELPFQGKPIEVAYQHAQAPVPPLSSKVPNLPTAVEQVVLKALAKDPRDRYPRVQEFAVALEQAALPVLRPQPGRPPAPGPVVSPHPPPPGRSEPSPGFPSNPPWAVPTAEARQPPVGLDDPILIPQ